MVSLHRELKRGGGGTKNKEETQNLRKKCGICKTFREAKKVYKSLLKENGQTNKKVKIGRIENIFRYQSFL